MRIYMNDGGKLDCTEIEIGMDGNIFADEYRIVPTDEVVRIVDDREPRPTRDEIISWLQEHEQAWEDFCEHFGTDSEEEDEE